MSARFDLSTILAPASVKPRTHGPRDVIDANTSKATTTAPACTRTATPAAPPPAPVVHFIPRPSAPRAPDAPPKGKQGMRSSPNQQAVLDAIAQHGTIKRSALPRATGLSDVQLGNALFLLGKAKKIAIGGARNDRIYGKPGTRFAKGTPVAQPRLALAKVEVAQGVERPDDPPFRLTPEIVKRIGHAPGHVRPGGFMLDPPENTDVTAHPCRAIRKADGGAIVLRGTHLIAELGADALDVLRQL